MSKVVLTQPAKPDYYVLHQKLKAISCPSLYSLKGTVMQSKHFAEDQFSTSVVTGGWKKSPS